MSNQYCLVYVTCPSEESALKISSHLVEQRLAACVSIAPITSVYRWKGEIQHDKEYQLTIKTKKDAFEELRNAVLSQHSYEVPEVVSVDILNGHSKYLEWIGESVTK